MSELELWSIWNTTIKAQSNFWSRVVSKIGKYYNLKSELYSKLWTLNTRMCHCRFINCHKYVIPDIDNGIKNACIDSVYKGITVNELYVKSFPSSPNSILHNVAHQALSPMGFLQTSLQVIFLDPGNEPASSYSFLLCMWGTF